MTRTSFLRKIIFLLPVLLLGVAISDAYSSPDSKYIKELEEAFAARILYEQGRISSSSRIPKDHQSIKVNENQVGPGVVASITSGLKDPFLSILASSEFASWKEIKDRYERAKKALEIFGVKYNAELTAAVALPAASGLAAVKALKAAQPATASVVPAVKKTIPGSIPGAATSIPGVTPPVVTPVEQPQSAKLTMPGVTTPGEGEEEEEAEEEATPTPAVATIPGATPKPATVTPPAMPGTNPVVAKPAVPVIPTIPGATPAPKAAPAVAKPTLPGGMPTA